MSRSAATVGKTKTAAWAAKFCLAATALLLIVANAAAVENKRIMMLDSVGREFRPWSEYAKDIRAELKRQSPWPLDVQEFTLAAARVDDERAEAPFVDYLRALYGDHPPDLIISVGAPSASFVQRHRRDLFSTTPMLFTVVDERRVESSALTEYDTVVAVRHNFRLLFESFLRISPDTKIVAIVNGDSPNERFWHEEIRRELQPLESRIDMRWYDKLSLEDLLKQTAALPPHSAIFWQQMAVDGAGIKHEGDSALQRISATANAPIFVHNDAYFGRDVVGGPMHSTLEGSRDAVAVAMRILGGEQPGTIKTSPSDYAPAKYDWRELQRWNISESRLPRASEIQFRQPSIWQVYRWQVSSVGTIIGLQALMITALLYQMRRRRLAEVEAIRRASELAHVSRVAVSGELTTSIAHELNQPLGAILANSETMETMLRSPTPDLKELGEIVSDIKRDDLRASSVISHLRSLLKKTPVETREIDLNEVARETLTLLTALAGARKITFSSRFAATPLPIKGDSVQLQQVLINLIMNAVDAMDAIEKEKRVVAVQTNSIDGLAEVTVSDAGPGIASDKMEQVFEAFFTTKETGMGMGLSIARTIIQAHDGQIYAENSPGGGAVFRVRLPLRQERTDRHDHKTATYS